jgi:hypothetical protein
MRGVVLCRGRLKWMLQVVHRGFGVVLSLCPSRVGGVAALLSACLNVTTTYNDSRGDSNESNRMYHCTSQVMGANKSLKHFSKPLQACCW